MDKFVCPKQMGQGKDAIHSDTALRGRVRVLHSPTLDELHAIVHTLVCAPCRVIHFSFVRRTFLKIFAVLGLASCPRHPHQSHRLAHHFQFSRSLLRFTTPPPSSHPLALYLLPAHLSLVQCPCNAPRVHVGLDHPSLGGLADPKAFPAARPSPSQIVAVPNGATKTYSPQSYGISSWNSSQCSTSSVSTTRLGT